MSGRPTARRQYVWLTLVAASIALGCGNAQETTEVRGNVTYNGQPVTYGLINFKPAAGKILGGEIQPDGTYRYDLPPGEYQVRIESSTPPLAEGETAAATPQAAGPQVPSTFANFATSGLTATVTAGDEQTIDFTLP